MTETYENTEAAYLRLQVSNLLYQQEKVKTSVLKTWTILEDIGSVLNYMATLPMEAHLLEDQQLNSSKIKELFESITTLYSIYFEELNNNVDGFEVMTNNLSSIFWSDHVRK